MTTEFGARLRLLTQPERACEGQLTVFRWVLDVGPGDVAALAVAAGRSYVTDDARLAYPAASVGDQVPVADSVRKGDFGEMVAMGIYSTRMGRTVPYSKLQLGKTFANATVQGPDTLCLTITQGEVVEPVVVEAKCRQLARASDVLGPIEESSGVVTEEYLVQAWVAGVQMMRSHPDHRRNFAFSAAQHLGRLIDSEAPLPPHLRHAVAVVGEDRLGKAEIEKRWTGAPYVSELHIVTVPDLAGTLSRVFTAAAALRYADLTTGAASAVPAAVRAGLTPGISGLVSPDVPRRLADVTAADPLRDIVEASLWFLADQDGFAGARASGSRHHVDADVRGLAELLGGALGGANATLKGRALEEFAGAARDVLDLQAPRDVCRRRWTRRNGTGSTRSFCTRRSMWRLRCCTAWSGTRS